MNSTEQLRESARFLTDLADYLDAEVPGLLPNEDVTFCPPMLYLHADTAALLLSYEGAVVRNEASPIRGIDPTPIQTETCDTYLLYRHPAGQVVFTGPAPEKIR